MGDITSRHSINNHSRNCNFLGHVTGALRGYHRPIIRGQVQRAGNIRAANSTRGAHAPTTATIIVTITITLRTITAVMSGDLASMAHIPITWLGHVSACSINNTARATSQQARLAIDTQLHKTNIKRINVKFVKKKQGRGHCAKRLVKALHNGATSMY